MMSRHRSSAHASPSAADAPTPALPAADAHTDPTTLELRVEGLCCTECAMAVEKALADRAGIRQLRILSAVEKVQVDFDPDTVSAADFAASIARLGYTVHTDTAPTLSAPARAHSTANTLRFAFLATVALIALFEIGGEYLGWFEAAKLPLPVLLAAIALGGYPIFRRALLGLLQRQINVDTMMTVGILGAAALGQYTASMLIVFFMNIAHSLEKFTLGKSHRAIRELVRLAPKTARIRVDGRETAVDVTALKAGDTVAIRPGEQIPADGGGVSGRSAVNEASITGESVPTEKQPGDTVYAATCNDLGYLEVRVTRTGPDTTFGKIVRLAEKAEAVKAPVQKFADRFTTWFLPLAIGVALLTYVLSGEALYAIAVLVAACPCAVGLATPLSVVASVGNGARHGLLIKGGLFLERLAQVDYVVMDKTGTVTWGRPQITDIISVSDTLSEIDALRYAAALETRSEHPLAAAILASARAHDIPIPEPENFDYRVGHGLRGTVAGTALLLGTARFLRDNGIAVDTVEPRMQALEDDGKTVLLLAVNGRVAAIIALADPLRDDVPAAIEALKRLGVQRLLLLTGDNERVAAAIARRIGVREFRAGLLPEDKIALVRELQRAGRRGHRHGGHRQRCGIGDRACRPDARRLAASAAGDHHRAPHRPRHPPEHRARHRLGRPHHGARLGGHTQPGHGCRDRSGSGCVGGAEFRAPAHCAAAPAGRFPFGGDAKEDLVKLHDVRQPSCAERRA